MISWEHFKDRVLPELHEQTWERATALMGSDDYAWMWDFYKMTPTDQLEHEFSDQERGDSWLQGGEASDYELFEWSDPTDQDTTLQIYRRAFSVTDIWLQYGKGSQLHRIAKLEKFMMDFLDMAYRTMADKAAALLLDGFTGTLLLLPDGQPLFDNAHLHGSGAATYDNYLTSKLSWGSVDAILDLSGAKIADQYGRPLHIKYDTAFCSDVGPNERLLRKINNDTVLPGATNGEANTLQGEFQRIITCPYLRNSVQSGAQDIWGLFDSSRYTWQCLLCEAPHIRPQTNTNPDIVQVNGRCIFEFFAESWEGTAASDGTTVAL